MNTKIDVLVSAFDNKFNLISHFNIIKDVHLMTQDDLENEIYNRFNEYIRYASNEYIKCRYMFIRPSSKDTEWVEWQDSITPTSYKYLTSIYYSKGLKITRIHYEDE